MSACLPACPPGQVPSRMTDAEAQKYRELADALTELKIKVRHRREEEEEQEEEEEE